MDGVSTDDELTDEQFAVIVIAEEEGPVAHVLDEYRARQRWAETGSTLTPSDLDDAAKLALIPRFARVLTEMIARGWIDLWWGLPWPQGSTVPADQSAAVLNDSASWIDRPDGDWRIIGMTTTARTSGNDAILDALLLRLHTETACRRGGALALRRMDLYPDQGLVRLREKGETLRWQPISLDLAAHLVDHADNRGAVADADRLLRYRDGRPMTSRRYDNLWKRIGDRLPWVAAQGISTHWLRHTTLTWGRTQLRLRHRPRLRRTHRQDRPGHHHIHQSRRTSHRHRTGRADRPTSPTRDQPPRPGFPQLTRTAIDAPQVFKPTQHHQSMSMAHQIDDNARGPANRVPATRRKYSSASPPGQRQGRARTTLQRRPAARGRVPAGAGTKRRSR